MEKCRVCGKQLDKLTASHLKTHGMTFDEYYFKYDKNFYQQRQLLQFINEYYISVRHRFLEYSKGQTYTITKGEQRSWGLCDNDIKQHLEGVRTKGIYFPKDYTRLIAFDIDSDIKVHGSIEAALLNSRENLYRLYSTLTGYGITEENMFISFSGKKGYHLDIFLSSMIDKTIVNKFYELILEDLRLSKKDIELRGGGNQGYKLPLGYHVATGNHCYLCNEYGIERMDILNKIHSIERLEISLLGEIVDINYIEEQQQEDINLMTAFEELDSTVRLLPTYSNTNYNRIKRVERLISEGHQEGSRQESIREVSAYCKDIKGLSLTETMSFINSWVNSTWNKDTVDEEVRGHIKNTVTSVYTTGYKFNVQANNITVTLPEIREIFSIKTRNKLQTEALRRLYYIHLLHSKAYAGEDGVYFMTLEQMSKMGASTNRVETSQQEKKLAEMGKLLIVQKGELQQHSFKKAPTKYKLNCFISYSKDSKEFKICNQGNMCNDCLERALCYLAEDKERIKYIKGNKYRYLEKCPHNVINK